jgi:hypothetical protein
MAYLANGHDVRRMGRRVGFSPGVANGLVMWPFADGACGLVLRALSNCVPPIEAEETSVGCLQFLNPLSRPLSFGSPEPNDLSHHRKLPVSA